jgi:MinD-like ATPase involved in chromosome partitioning or flagellar assembly
MTPPELLSSTREDPWAEAKSPAAARPAAEPAAEPEPAPEPAPPSAALPAPEPERPAVMTPTPTPDWQSAPPATPLVAVCGLAEGAGTTLLAWLLALEALRDGEDPVLLTELPACGGGLARLTGVEDGRSLASLAVESAATRSWSAAGGAPAGLNLAAGPVGIERERGVDPEQVAAALAAARATQARVVVDCGRLHDAVARRVLADASHVVWTVPADAAAGDTARALLLDSELAPPPGGAIELLAVVATRQAELPPRAARALRDVVAGRAERLVLVPHAGTLARGGPGRSSSRRLSSSIGALAGALRRTSSP